LYSAQNQAKELKLPGKDAFSKDNKHESLFCCGRRGVNFFILHTAQFFFKLTIAFFAFKLTSINEEFTLLKKDIEVIVHAIILVLAIIVLIYIWFFNLPSFLTSFTITTNVSKSLPTY